MSGVLFVAVYRDLFYGVLGGVFPLTSRPYRSIQFFKTVMRRYRACWFSDRPFGTVLNLSLWLLKFSLSCENLERERLRVKYPPILLPINLHFFNPSSKIFTKNLQFCTLIQDLQKILKNYSKYGIIILRKIIIKTGVCYDWILRILREFIR